MGETAGDIAHARRLLTAEQIAFVSEILLDRGLPFCLFGVRDIYCLPGAADPTPWSPMASRRCVSSPP